MCLCGTDFSPEGPVLLFPQTIVSCVPIYPPSSAFPSRTLHWAVECRLSGVSGCSLQLQERAGIVNEGCRCSVADSYGTECEHTLCLSFSLSKGRETVLSGLCVLREPRSSPSVSDPVLLGSSSTHLSGVDKLWFLLPVASMVSPLSPSLTHCMCSLVW